MITDDLQDLVRRALESAAAEGLLATEEIPEASFERPRHEAHGDWSTNVALAAPRQEGTPRHMAEAIRERLPSSDLVERVEVAGPGFLNFYLSEAWLHDVVRRASDPSAGFGRSEGGRGQRINLEYVSANPTGPINVVSGRHAAVGDAIGNLLEATGHEVVREFYVNDAGRQIDLFAASLSARYMQHFGRDEPVPEEGYKGDYLRTLAADLAAEVGEALVEITPEERAAKLRDAGIEAMLEEMRASLASFGTTFDNWFREHTLHEQGWVKEALDRLGDRGMTYEKDGALWFRSSELGDDKDRVLVRASGEPTYLAPDLAYMTDKFARGFDRLIYLLGADHHGTIPRFLAGAEALGFERERVEMPIVQIVTLKRAGEAVKGSKRQGILVPLDELVREVGADAARYTFLTRSIDSSLEFDIDLAKEQAPENPVFYVQYAHARICSIMRKAEGEGRSGAGAAALERLHHPSELALIRKIASFEEVVPEAARLRAPQRITRYLGELAASFSAFYRDARVVSEDAELTAARLQVCLATRSVLASGLALVGVGAPERM